MMQHSRYTYSLPGFIDNAITSLNIQWVELYTSTVYFLILFPFFNTKVNTGKFVLIPLTLKFNGVNYNIF